MAVHLPLSDSAQKEAQEIIAANKKKPVEAGRWFTDITY